MSHTVSRGHHRIGRWASPALAVKEGLENNTLPPQGALVAVERLLSWMLAGVTLEEGGATDVRPVAARSALDIGRVVFFAIYGVDPPLRRIRERGQAYLTLVQRMRQTKQIPEIGKNHGEVPRLQIFLRELVRLGEIDRAARLL